MMKSALLASAASAPPLPVVVDIAAPILVPLRRATEISGLSKSTLYLHAMQGRLTLKKAGKRTLVDYASLKSLLEGLPTAQLRNAA